MPKLLISDQRSRIFDVPFLAPAGMKGGRYSRLSQTELIPLPYGSELFMLPDRMPVGYDPASRRLVTLKDNPFAPGKRCFPVAAFVSPGYTSTFNTAYEESGSPALLPLFAYTAAAFYKGRFYAAAVRVDAEKRQDLRLMDLKAIDRNVVLFRKIFPKNRLMRHLESCAQVYGCPAGRNFFLSRYEAPLPTSPSCNSQCLGCISYQPGKKCPITQPRIKFVPTPEEIAETAIWHISRVKDPVVSFGQGCEGEPLMSGETIEKAVRLIRAATDKGIINLNTNASRPDMVRRLFDAGLDSIRVSMNSVRKEYYARYYNPRGYTFMDVLRSIDIAKQKKRFVSINYLSAPGFTDSWGEYTALRHFLKQYHINMIQWRNLNYDPLGYYRSVGKVPADGTVGMREVVHRIHREFPGVMKGYFNPSRKRMRRFNKREKKAWRVF